MADQEVTASDIDPGKKVAVLGFGSILMKDDGVGSYVVKTLETSYEFGQGVSILDIGTPGLGVEQYIAGLDALIVIDTVRATGQPGEVRTYRLEDILKHFPAPRMSPHDPGLKEALLSLDFSDLAPREVLLVGVIPAEVELGIGLSPIVQEAIPRIEAEVIQELVRLGVSVQKRAQPLAQDIWWERS